MLTFGNSKLRKSMKLDGIMVAAFSLPAGKTCPFAGECRKFCYASVGTASFPRVKNFRENNYKASQSTSFVKDMIQEIKELAPDVVRLHDSGDFYSREYAQKWRQIMESCPETLFYCYSKSHEYVQELDGLDNFTCIPSVGGIRDDLVAGPRAIPWPESKAIPSDGVEGSENDLDNLLNILEGKNVYLRAHGARRSNVA